MLVKRLSNSVSGIACLAARRLGEPERPFVHQGVLDVEVVFVMEDGDLFVVGWPRSTVLVGVVTLLSVLAMGTSSIYCW